MSRAQVQVACRLNTIRPIKPRFSENGTGVATIIGTTIEARGVLETALRGCYNFEQQASRRKAVQMSDVIQVL